MKLTERHQLAIDLMIDGLSYVKIAERLGVAVGTVRSWTRAPEFQALKDLRVDEIREGVKGNLVAARSAALAFLTEALRDDTVSLDARVRIAEITLDRTGDSPHDGNGADAVLAKLIGKMTAGDP